MPRQQKKRVKKRRVKFVKKSSKFKSRRPKKIGTVPFQNQVTYCNYDSWQCILSICQKIPALVSAARSQKPEHLLNNDESDSTVDTDLISEQSSDESPTISDEGMFFLYLW